ncbi:twin-arginine translocase TatA/TatE family subunit [Methylomonas koyamae]|uniref:twin-arginine translocase TatA/TatE family subunit n=1 Tax=Methylomonas koyamae TaxID=702114 RepID=UPI0009EECC80|nr:hypothetical protein MKLM6_1628 [Methylomonas koyamae]
MGFSVPHLLVVLAIVVLVFGTKRLKDVGTDLGDAIKDFRKAVQEGEADAAGTGRPLAERRQFAENRAVTFLQGRSPAVYQTRSPVNRAMAALRA